MTQRVSALLTLSLLLLAASSFAQGNQAEQDLAFAQGLYGQENYELAAEKFKAFVAAYPNHANASLAGFRAGECLSRLGKFADGAPYFETVTQKFPTSAEAEPAWLWLGDARFQAGQYEPAATAYEGLLAKFPNSEHAGRAAYWRAESYYQLGKHEQAISAYQDALGRKLGAEESAYALYAIGWTYLHVNEAKQAVDPLQQVLAKYADSPVAAECQYLLGTAHQALKEWDPALAAFQKTLANHGQSKFAAFAQAGVGWCHFGRKNYAEAQKAFEAVPAKYPASPAAAEAQLRAADCLYYLQKWPEAAARYEKIAADPKGKWAAEAAYWLGMTWDQQGDAAKALAAYERVAKDFPESKRVADAHLRIGALQSAAGKGDAAAAAYQAALDKAADDATKRRAQEGLAWAKFQSTKSETALADLEKVVRADPKSPQSAELGLQVAQAHFTAQRYPQAAEVAELLLGAEPPAKSLGGLLYLAGASHEKLGHDPQAEQLYRRVLAEAKESEYAGHSAAALVGLAAKKGDLAQATQLAVELKKAGASPDALAFGLYTVAEALYKQKKFVEAIPLYQGAADAAPESDTAAFALLGLGWARLSADEAGAGDTFLALADKHAQSDAAKRVPEGLLAVAEKAFEKEKYADAEALYRRILDRFAQSDLADEAQYKLGWALLKQDKPDQAQPLFAQAAEKADQAAVAADARYQAGRLLADKRDFERAAQLLDPFRQKHQDAAQAPLALELLGRCNLELGRDAPAMEAFGQVLTKYAQHPAAKLALVGQARVYRRQKNLDKAEECLRKALEGDAAGAGMEAQFELAGCARDRGDLKRAAEEYLKVAILYADEDWAARSQYEAGQCYEQLQDKPLAAKTYKVIVDRYPKQQQWVEKAQGRIKELGG